MDSETKVVYHGTTVVETTSNPPPYSSFPPPGPPGPGIYVAQPTAIIHSPTSSVIVKQQVGPQPMPMVCKSCNAQVVTRVEKLSSTKTHLFALGLCLLGCWCCVCVPYCIDSCANVNHYCPNCNAYIGVYKE